MNKLVSVIIPVFNREQLVIRAIDSVLAQTYQAIEILVIDDNSTDQTWGTLEKYGSKIIKIKNSRNKGPAGARNEGMIAAKGEYLAFLDSDDSWLPEKVASQVKLLEQGSGHFSATWVNYENYNVDDHLKPNSGRVFSRIVKESFICTSSVMISKYAENKIGLMNEALFGTEDLEYWLRISHRYNLFTVEQPLTIYSRIGESLSAVSNKFGRPEVDFFYGRIKALEFAKQITDIQNFEVKEINQSISRLYSYKAYEQGTINIWESFKFYIKAIRLDPKLIYFFALIKMPIRYLLQITK